MLQKLLIFLYIVSICNKKAYFPFNPKASSWLNFQNDTKPKIFIYKCHEILGNY